MKFHNIYFINGTAYAGRSTLVKGLAEKYWGILCEENYHDRLLGELDSEEFPALTYTRDLEDWRQFIRRISSQKRYDEFLHAGFPVLLRDEERTAEETLALAAEIFRLPRAEG